MRGKCEHGERTAVRGDGPDGQARREVLEGLREGGEGGCLKREGEGDAGWANEGEGRVRERGVRGRMMRITAVGRTGRGWGRSAGSTRAKGKKEVWEGEECRLEAVRGGGGVGGRNSWGGEGSGRGD